MNKITTRQQFEGIPKTDIVLIVKKQLSKSRKHYAKCWHLNTEIMKSLNLEEANSEYYHYKKDEENKIK